MPSGRTVTASDFVNFIVQELRREHSGVHRHKCSICAHVWEHTNALASESTEEEYKLAHTCPNCGKGDERDRCFADEDACATLSKQPDTALARVHAVLERKYAGRLRKAA